MSICRVREHIVGTPNLAWKDVDKNSRLETWTESRSCVYFIERKKNYQYVFLMNFKVLGVDTGEQKEIKPEIKPSFGIMVKMELNVFALLD